MTVMRFGAPIVTHFIPGEHGLLLGKNPPTGECPVCGEEIETGSLRWTGYSWEHKSREAHGQAGHHIIYPRSGPP